ncbi:hypothetical protein CSPX01_02790 [Colletotrichum filicis]|nr:hypothetical protein CSPX01_02790 [Colletotrichum filicis]
MAGATFSSLPNELITMISHHCADAYPLCLVNQRTLPLAQQGLYHTIKLPHTHYNQLVLLIRTLVETPHLRRLIREVDISLGPDAYYDPSKMKTPEIFDKWHKSVLDESKLSDAEGHILLLCRQHAAMSRLNLSIIMGLLIGLLLCFVPRIYSLAISQVQDNNPASHRLQTIGLRTMLFVAISTYSVEGMKRRVCPELKWLVLLPSSTHFENFYSFGAGFKVLECFVAHPTLEAVVSSYDFGHWGLTGPLSSGTSLSMTQLILRPTGMNATTLSRALSRFPKLTHLFVEFDSLSSNGGIVIRDQLGHTITECCPCIEHLSLRFPEQGINKFFGQNPTLEIHSLISSTWNLSGLEVFRSRIAMYYSLLEGLDERAALLRYWVPRQAKLLLLDTTDTGEDMTGAPYFEGVKSLVLSLCRARQVGQLRFGTVAVSVHVGGNIDWHEVVQEARKYGAGTDFRLMVVFFPAMRQAFWASNWREIWREEIDIPARLSKQGQQQRAIVDSG